MGTTTILFLFLIFYIVRIIDGSPLTSNENKDAKIVGGRQVPADKFSWEVSVGLSKYQAKTKAERQQQPPLYKESTHHCDGVLLSNEWVMTAGHCGVNRDTSKPFEPKDLLVGIQSKDLDQIYDNGRLPVSQVIVKPGHLNGKSTSKNDITLLRLATPLSTNVPIPAGAKPYACLPKQNDQQMEHYPGTLTSIGFGNVQALYYDIPTNKIVSGIQPSRYLKEIDVVDITNEANTDPRSVFCQGRTDLICITAIKTTDSTCQGDSGGSLIDQNGDLVVGIISFGDNKGYDQSHTVTCIGDTAYTRLAVHTAWIQSYVPSLCLK